MAAADTPQGIRVDKTGGTGMEIDWADGHKSHYGFQWLRDACPCATCEEERETTGAQYGDPPKPKNALHMYREPARPKEVIPVGKYAIQFTWNDGHATGLYTWPFLRDWCQCAECKAARAKK